MADLKPLIRHVSRTILLGIALGALPLFAQTGSFTNRIGAPAYEYEFVVDVHTTMTATRPKDRNALLFFKDGKFFKRDAMVGGSCTDSEATDYTADEVNVADGDHMEILAINGKMPSPTIVAERGKEVTVHVINKYIHPITVHWHGLDQKNNFYFDGVAGVTQCPIAPGEKFTYRIKTDDHPGTYWYHLHGAVVHEGIQGAFIILEPGSTPANKPKQEDFVALLSDWFPQTMEELFVRLRDSQMKYQDIRDPEHCFAYTRDTAGQVSTGNRFHAFLVNGRGWHHKSGLKLDDDAEWDARHAFMEENKHTLPLEKFQLTAPDPNDKSHQYPKIRLVNAASTFMTIVVSVSGHKLRLVASDGYPLKSDADVDFVSLTNGERFDVELVPLTAGAQDSDFYGRSYEMLLTTTEERDIFHSQKSSLWKKYGLALVVYAKSGTDKPVPTAKASHIDSMEHFKKRCTATSKCIVANCPFKEYAKDSSLPRTCLHLYQLTGEYPDKDGILKGKADLGHTFYINGRSGGCVETGFGHILNRIAMVSPKYPPFMEAAIHGKVKKSIVDCRTPKFKKSTRDLKRCTHILYSGKNAVVDVILLNIKKAVCHGAFGGRGEIGVPSVFGYLNMVRHPMHLHGQHFYVTHQGWAEHDEMGMFKTDAPDVKARGIDKWEVKLAQGKAVAPVYKDTVWVPYGGYVALRFKADNPGWWMFHCHLVLHMADGMALILKVGEDKDMPPIPADFPFCGDAITAKTLADPKAFANLAGKVSKA